MLADVWHHWMLLRPLLVFTLAGPLIVGAVLSRLGRGQPDDADAAPTAPALQCAATGDEQKPQPGPALAATPREWPLAGEAAERHAA